MDVEKTSNSIYNLIRSVEKVPTFDENEMHHDPTWQEPKAENERDEQGNQKDKDDQETLPASQIPKNMSGSIMKVRICICHVQISAQYSMLIINRERRLPLSFIISYNQDDMPFAKAVLTTLR